jgi:Bacterial PH domain
MGAERIGRDRVYRSSLQLVAGLGLSVVMVALAVGCVLQPTARSHGGYVIAVVAIVLAAGMVKFALSGVRVSADGVRVMNVFRTTAVKWEEIEEFRLSTVGACVVMLKDGGAVPIDGIEQTNLEALTRRKNTSERNMIEELNELLQKHNDACLSVAAVDDGRPLQS